MVLINNSPEIIYVETKRFRENIRNFKKGKEVLTNIIYNLDVAIPIEGKSALILELG